MPRVSNFLRTTIVFLFLLTASVASTAQQSPEHAAAAVDEVFADVAKPNSPGCALAVAREGKLLYAKGYGFANLEQNLPISPDSVFDIGSTSKQFAAASI